MRYNILRNLFFSISVNLKDTEKKDRVLKSYKKLFIFLYTLCHLSEIKDDLQFVSDFHVYWNTHVEFSIMYTIHISRLRHIKLY